MSYLKLHEKDGLDTSTFILYTKNSIWVEMWGINFHIFYGMVGEEGCIIQTN